MDKVPGTAIPGDTKMAVVPLLIGPENIYKDYFSILVGQLYVYINALTSIFFLGQHSFDTVLSFFNKFSLKKKKAFFV